MNWDQFQTILWLRWRLSRNRFARGGPVNAVLAILMMVLLAMGSAAAGIAGVAGGAFGLAKARPEVLLLVWDGIIFVFLMFWIAGLMAEIQRSESIDLAKLLHLPVTLRQVFVFNYLASHLTPGILLLLPGMVGLCAGLTLGAGAGMALLLPLVLSFIFMLTSWTYCLRGWLAALMVNKRRRRAIVVWITLVFIGLTQLPNLLVNSRWTRRPGSGNQPFRGVGGLPASGSQRSGFELPDPFVLSHLAVPPGWIGYGAMTLRRGNVWPALGPIAAGGLLGVLGLMRAYRMTLRFYQAAEGKSAARPVRRRAEAKAGGRLLVERRLPGVPDEVAALALASFRSLLRAPELKMAFIMPLVMVVALGSVQFTRPRQAPPEALTAFAGTAAAALAAFSFMQIMSNAFGLDRNGFRALVLLPTRRHYILLAKNLAFLPFVAVVGVILLVLAKFFVRMSWGGFLAGLLQVPLAFLLFSLLCNLTSVLAPYRLAAGTLQARKPKPVVFLAAFGTMLAMPMVLAPTVLPPGLQLLVRALGGPGWLPVNFLVSSLMLAGVAWFYWLVLPSQGRLLQRREQTILREVTEEVE